MKIPLLFLTLAIPLCSLVAGAVDIAAESKRANEFFDKCWDEAVARHPVDESFYGIKTHYDQLEDLSDEKAAADLKALQDQLATLHREFKLESLDAPTQVSYKLFELEVERAAEEFRFRNDVYPISQMRGVHAQIPTFLINIHKVDNEKDARAYIARLNAIPKLFDQVIVNLRTCEGKGVVAPKFVFPLVLEACHKVIGGAPFNDSGTDSPLLADFKKKVGALKEVARIHGEMEKIREKVGFKGDLSAFFKFMREDPQFYLPDTDEGRAKYLAKAVQIVDEMKKRLDELFLTKPKADIVVKAVEKFRESSAGAAFYQQPAPDGSRPGMFYVNLRNMHDQPVYELEALAHHEGIPGHHMQIAIAQELSGIPKFRKLGARFTAYTEGWGLYSELTPKEIGMYQDPYSDFGRLSLELLRAARLVVDTGMHAKKWTRDQAIDYLKQNTPNSEGDRVDAINRYILMPSQATAYKIGMLKILEFREKAKHALGAKFDLHQFHDVVLTNGALPLDVLEELVNRWIKSKQT